MPRLLPALALALLAAPALAQPDAAPPLPPPNTAAFAPLELPTPNAYRSADGRPGPTGTGGFRAEAGRYRLYVALICPWASRTLIARKLKALEDLVAVTVVNPVLTDQGWAFGGYPGADAEPLHGAGHLHQLYSRADASYRQRSRTRLPFA